MKNVLIFAFALVVVSLLQTTNVNATINAINLQIGDSTSVVSWESFPEFEEFVLHFLLARNIEPVGDVFLAESDSMAFRNEHKMFILNFSHERLGHLQLFDYDNEEQLRKQVEDILRFVEEQGFEIDLNLLDSNGNRIDIVAFADFAVNATINAIHLRSGGEEKLMEF
ncbi:MAG: hypothetical protein FWG68_00940 [Defluviitaleaceae bacterium]|nr:hypothetical protein [Defluviitaleaceae bacterium]